MSHIVSISAQVLNPEGVGRACSRLGLEAATYETVHFFDGQSKTGLVVKLSGWDYPVVINTETGEVHADNFNGEWGSQEQLNSFLQAYSVEVAKMAAEAQGYQVTEELLADGSIHLNVLISH